MVSERALNCHLLEVQSCLGEDERSVGAYRRDRRDRRDHRHVPEIQAVPFTDDTAVGSPLKKRILTFVLSYMALHQVQSMLVFIQHELLSVLLTLST